MKTQMIAVFIVALVAVGGLSMGCLDYTIDDAFPTDNGGLTAQGLQVKADVAERQARGFVQYTGANNTVNETVQVTVEIVEDVPIIYSSRCYVRYPDNVMGFDTPYERASVYQAMLNEKLAAMDTLTVSQYLTPNGMSYEEFYINFYQGLQEDYEKVYCSVGNKVIGDFELTTPVNISLNSSA